MSRICDVCKCSANNEFKIRITTIGEPEEHIYSDLCHTHFELLKSRKNEIISNLKIEAIEYIKSFSLKETQTKFNEQIKKIKETM